MTHKLGTKLPEPHEYQVENNCGGLSMQELNGFAADSDIDRDSSNNCLKGAPVFSSSASPPQCEVAAGERTRTCRLLERQLKLVVCILLRVHADYESLRRAPSTQAFRNWFRRFPRIAEILGEEPEEKRLHSMNDPKWDKYPRIDWYAESEEE